MCTYPVKRRCSDCGDWSQFKKLPENKTSLLTKVSLKKEVEKFKPWVIVAGVQYIDPTNP